MFGFNRKPSGLIEAELEKEADPSASFEELNGLYDKLKKYSYLTVQQGDKEVAFADSQEGKLIQARIEEIWHLCGQEPMFVELRAKLDAENEANRKKTKKMIADAFREKDQEKINSCREVLEISGSAGAEERRQAYLRKAQKWHPDHNPGNEEAARVKFEEAKEAYDYLKDLITD